MEYFEAYVTKEVTRDNWKDGEIGKTEIMLLSEKVCCSPTLFDCIKKAFDTMDIKVDGYLRDELIAYVKSDDEDFYWTKTENEKFYEPTEDELSDWKAGKIDLYSASYTFKFKKVTIQEITKEDISKIL